MSSSRERVLLALDHKEPDRMPIAPPMGMVNIDDEVKRFIEKFDFDRFVGLNFKKNVSGSINKAVSDRRKLSDEILVDNYGCKYRYRAVGMPYCIYNPLGNAKRVDDIEDYRKWPDPDDPSLILEDAHKSARELYEEADYVTVVGVPNIFHRYQRLRGFSKWLIDMKTHPELYESIADRIYNFSLLSTLRLLNEVGDYTNLARTWDDMGFTTGPFMSVEDFREYVKPYYSELIGSIKREFPKIKFWFHCHGNITKLIPDLIDSGVDVLNPILPGDNMDSKKIKEEFGDQLSFDGGADVEYIIPFGTVEEVREHSREVIRILSPGGGYIFRVQMISNVVPAENLYTVYKTAFEHGHY